MAGFALDEQHHKYGAFLTIVIVVVCFPKCKGFAKICLAWFGDVVYDIFIQLYFEMTSW